MKNGNTTNAGATFTGVAKRNGKVLLATVMNPAKHEHNEVYKEAAKLFDWGFRAEGKVNPVGELVAPTGAARADTRPSVSHQEAQGTGGSTALGIVGGLLVLLSGGVFLINRHWPLPDLVRRRKRS